MKKGDRLPDISFRTRSLGEWKDVSTDNYFKGKRVILFALPGAFTPTCSNQQLPGYEKLHDVFKEHGIDDIYWLSINDSYVMNAWAANQKLEKVKVIPDGNGDFTDQVDMLVEKQDCGFGMRSWRYAAIVNDCTVEVMFEEPGKVDNNDGDPYSVSSPENVLKYLQSMAVDSNAI